MCLYRLEIMLNPKQHAAQATTCWLCTGQCTGRKNIYQQTGAMHCSMVACLSANAVNPLSANAKLSKQRHGMSERLKFFSGRESAAALRHQAPASKQHRHTSVGKHRLHDAHTKRKGHSCKAVAELSTCAGSTAIAAIAAIAACAN